MSELCEHETFKDVCGICHRDGVITRLRADNERLTRQFAEHADRTADDTAALRAENERLREWNREIALNARELVAENERLRAVLRPFAEAADGFDMPRIKNPEEWFAYRGIVSATEAKGAITVGDLRRARAALEGK